MDDKYQQLREALAAGPTPGPWVCDWSPDDKPIAGEYADVSVWKDKAFDGKFINNICFDNAVADGNYIAAANPAAIQALLAECDALRVALQAAVDCGMVPKSSASEGGANKYSEQVRVADQIRAALSL